MIIDKKFNLLIKQIILFRILDQIHVKLKVLEINLKLQISD
jgi:hypothetical protein